MLVHPILTGEQAELIHQALIALLNTPEGDLSTDPGEEHLTKTQLSELVYFFNEVVDKPEQFGLRSEKEVQAIVRAERSALKGPAQPKSRRKPKGANAQKRDRQAAKEWAEEYNRARAQVEAEQAEAEKAWKNAMKEKIERFERLAGKDALTNSEFVETLELLELPEVALRAKELNEMTPEERIAAAQAKAERESDPLE